MSSIRKRKPSSCNDTAAFRVKFNVGTRDSECACLLSDFHWGPANSVDYTIFCYATLKRGRLTKSTLRGFSCTSFARACRHQAKKKDRLVKRLDIHCFDLRPSILAAHTGTAGRIGGRSFSHRIPGKWPQPRITAAVRNFLFVCHWAPNPAGKKAPARCDVKNLIRWQGDDVSTELPARRARTIRGEKGRGLRLPLIEFRLDSRLLAMAPS